ncbi:hypothetical protein [Bathymodiolus japonicus methanotrophic gill symbiont]|uniref:hypothetical protein n=1 Tax=Bathymodiolus japonicus methanotrophic gill symbiont TaxID=113269 RepID=UPI001C8E8D54|nr:hypothetical protein [Bathymodiolus japonicus methanotrophic gill symbiont]
MAIMVFFYPATINNFGETYKQSYVTQHQIMAEQALIALQQGNNKPIQNLLREDLGAIKKGDRLYPMKRQLILALVQQSYKQNTDKSWVDWGKEWYQLDGRDVTAMAYYYAALLQSDKDYAEGLLGLEMATQRFPQHSLLNQFYQAEISRSANSKD